MNKYPTLEEIIKDEKNRLNENNLIKIVKEPTLSSQNSSWRDTDAAWDQEREIKSKNSAIVDYFKIDESELGRFEIIKLGIIASHHSSVVKSTTFLELNLALDKKTKIGYFLNHSDTYYDLDSSPKVIRIRSDKKTKVR